MSGDELFFSAAGDEEDSGEDDAGVLVPASFASLGGAGFFDPLEERLSVL